MPRRIAATVIAVDYFLRNDLQQVGVVIDWATQLRFGIFCASRVTLAHCRFRVEWAHRRKLGVASIPPEDSAVCNTNSRLWEMFASALSSRREVLPLTMCMMKKRMLFVCVENSNRSQMAE